MRTVGAVSGFNSFYVVLLDHIDRARGNPSVHAAHGNCERNWEILQDPCLGRDLEDERRAAIATVTHKARQGTRAPSEI